MLEEQGRLSIAFAAGVEVDVPRVLSGNVPVEQAKRLQSGELLAGLAFDDEPGFDSWLLLQRSRVSAAVGEVLAWAASTLARTALGLVPVRLTGASVGRRSSVSRPVGLHTGGLG